MDRIIPWPELAAAVQTVYPKISENGGQPPIPLERMLRIYFLQLWFNLSDPAVAEATRVWGDQGYQGQTDVIRARAPNAKDLTNRRYRYRGRINEVEKAKNLHRLEVTAALANLYLVRRRLLRA